MIDCRYSPLVKMPWMADLIGSSMLAGSASSFAGGSLLLERDSLTALVSGHFGILATLTPLSWRVASTLCWGSGSSSI